MSVVVQDSFKIGTKEITLALNQTGDKDMLLRMTTLEAGYQNSVQYALPLLMESAMLEPLSYQNFVYYSLLGTKSGLNSLDDTKELMSRIADPVGLNGTYFGLSTDDVDAYPGGRQGLVHDLSQNQTIEVFCFEPDYIEPEGSLFVAAKKGVVRDTFTPNCLVQLASIYLDELPESKVSKEKQRITDFAEMLATCSWMKLTYTLLFPKWTSIDEEPSSYVDRWALGESEAFKWFIKGLLMGQPIERTIMLAKGEAFSW